MKLEQIYDIIIMLLWTSVGDEKLIIFLYLGILAAIILIVLMYGIDNILMIRRKIPKSQRIKYLENKLLARVLISCILASIIAIALPLLIWFGGKKEYATEETVISNVNLVDLPNDTGEYYVGQETDNNGVFYVYQLFGTQFNALNKSKVSDVEIAYTKQGEIPRYTEIATYNKVRLVENKILFSWVNNCFASISGWQESLKGKRVKLYIPKDTVLNPYVPIASK